MKSMERIKPNDYFTSGCTGCGSGYSGKLKTETTPLGRIDYTYDTIGRRKSMTVAGQPVVNYNYPNIFPRRQEIQATINGVSKTFTLQADQVGRRDTLTFPNGVTTDYNLYDNASRLKTLRHLDPLQNVLESIVYEYDANGNRTSVDRPSVTAPLPPVVTGITLNNANQMTTFNSRNITYDFNGNMTSWNTSCGTTNYSWNVRNQLIGISGYKPDCSALTASFKYDALGRRIEKTINGRTIKYLYDGVDIVQEIENSVPSVNYIRSLNIDEPLARIELATTPNRVRYYHTDALGSVIGLSNESGQMVTRYAYGAFGDVAVIGEASENPFQFAGRENDGTGLYYYRARYYNPQLQRFISEDLIGLLGGINMYSYVGNQPINRKDPLGLDYGNKDCSYYQKMCKENGGLYYCTIVPFFCENWPDNTPGMPDNWDECVRQCLQDFDKKYCHDPCKNNDRYTCEADAHLICFSKCYAYPNEKPAWVK